MSSPVQRFTIGGRLHNLPMSQARPENAKRSEFSLHASSTRSWLEGCCHRSSLGLDTLAFCVVDAVPRASLIFVHLELGWISALMGLCSLDCF